MWYKSGIKLGYKTEKPFYNLIHNTYNKYID